MADYTERQYIQHLRTTGTTAPVETEELIVHDGELVVGMNNTFPKLFIKKQDGTFEEFVGLSELLNAEFAIHQALTDLNNRVTRLREIVGDGIPGTTITDYVQGR